MRKAQFSRWLDKRIPAKKEHLLTRRNLFIFPSKQGFMFLLIALVLWVLGTNYQNNLILALVFFMIALFVVAIHATFGNMSKLQIKFLECKEAFAGDTFQCRLLITLERKSWADGLELYWQGAKSESVSLSLNPTDASVECNVPCYAKKRGLLILPRLGVQSVFPFGLIRCWTWLNVDTHAIIYPKPLSGRLESLSIEESDGDGLHPVKGSDDFSGLRDYVPGDNLRNVAWKAYARGQGLFVKEFSQSLSKENWLNFESVAEVSLEDKLSVLCFYVLQQYQSNESYGLILPGVKIEPNDGYEHRNNCLFALATFRTRAEL